MRLGRASPLDGGTLAGEQSVGRVGFGRRGKQTWAHCLGRRQQTPGKRKDACFPFYSPRLEEIRCFIFRVVVALLVVEKKKTAEFVVGCFPGPAIHDRILVMKRNMKPRAGSCLSLQLICLRMARPPVEFLLQHFNETARSGRNLAPPCPKTNARRRQRISLPKH